MNRRTHARELHRHDIGPRRTPRASSEFRGALEPCDETVVEGVVKRIRLDPAEGVVEMWLWDGRALQRATWELRRPVAQLRAQPGTRVRLRGPRRADAHGDLVTWEPTIDVMDGARE